MRQLFMLITLITLTGLAGGTAMAQDKPTAGEARKVIDYYYHGKGQGAVLMDLQTCEGVGLEAGPQKNECLKNIDPGQIQIGQELQVWMNFLVPVDDTAEIIVSFSRKDKVRHTANVKLTGATRFRTWKRIPTDKAGLWTLTIIQELEDRDLELGRLQYKVSEATQ